MTKKKKKKEAFISKVLYLLAEGDGVIICGEEECILFYLRMCTLNATQNNQNCIYLSIHVCRVKSLVWPARLAKNVSLSKIYLLFLGVIQEIFSPIMCQRFFLKKSKREKNVYTVDKHPVCQKEDF